MLTARLSPGRRRSPQLRAQSLRPVVVGTLVIASVVVAGLWADGRLDTTFDPQATVAADISPATGLTGAMAIHAQGRHGDAVRIAFVPQWFASSSGVAYQYRLEGVDLDWKALSDHGAVNYVGIAPGTYALAVRALAADGMVSSRVATVAFRVVPPFWRRAEFLLFSTGLVIVTTYTGYRRRTRRLVEMANMRTRIATDLHDDIGANLTRVAVLSELIRRQKPSPAVAAQLSAIAHIARESVSGMSDIVWAIDPERDRLVDVVRKMRAHAEETATDAALALGFDVSDAGLAPPVAMDLRRDVFLIFKEAVNNAARHAHCRHLAITVRSTRRALDLRIADDGIGFDPQRASDGNGLVNMQRRAQRIGATLSIVSAPGSGTTVRLTLALRGRARAAVATS